MVERFVLEFRAKPGRANSRLTRVLTLVLYPKTKKNVANIKVRGAHLWCSAETRAKKRQIHIQINPKSERENPKYLKSEVFTE